MQSGLKLGLSSVLGGLKDKRASIALCYVVQVYGVMRASLSLTWLLRD